MSILYMLVDGVCADDANHSLAKGSRSQVLALNRTLTQTLICVWSSGSVSVQVSSVHHHGSAERAYPRKSGRTRTGGQRSPQVLAGMSPHGCATEFVLVCQGTPFLLPPCPLHPKHWSIEQHRLRFDGITPHHDES